MLNAEQLDYSNSLNNVIAMADRGGVQEFLWNPPFP